MAETIYPKGMRLWPPRDNAPDFIKGSLTVHMDTFTEWAQEHTDEKGYVRLDLKEGRDGALYLALNTFKKGEKRKDDTETRQDKAVSDAYVEPKEEVTDDDVPF